MPVRRSARPATRLLGSAINSGEHSGASPRPRFGVRISGLLEAATAATCLFSAIAYAGGLHWLPDVFSDFRLQYAAFLFVAAPVLFILRKRIVPAIATAFFVLNLIEVITCSLPAAVLAPTGKTPLKILSVNIERTNQDDTALAGLIKAENPGLIFIYEVDARRTAVLASLKAAYPIFREAPRSDNFGIAFYGRSPAVSVYVPLRCADLPPYFVVKVETADGPVTVIAMHTTPPIGGELSNLQRIQLEEVARHIKSAGKRVIVVGDLNATPYSHRLRKFMAESGLLDRFAGRPFEISWPMRPWSPSPFSVRIDHCLSTPDVEPVSVRIGPDVGSDHLPVIAEFRI